MFWNIYHYFLNTVETLLSKRKACKLILNFGTLTPNWDCDQLAPYLQTDVTGYYRTKLYVTNKQTVLIEYALLQILDSSVY